MTLPRMLAFGFRIAETLEKQKVTFQGWAPQDMLEPLNVKDLIHDIKYHNRPVFIHLFYIRICRFVLEMSNVSEFGISDTPRQLGENA